jgi:hypothetical protein
MTEKQKDQAKKVDYKAIYTNNNSMRRQTVYSADDHFLIASATGYNERYTRFFFKDIVALKVRINKNSHLILVIYIILALLTFALTFIVSSMGFRVFWGIIFLALLTGSLWILFCGPQCKLVFKTLTSEEEFPMGRRNKVMKGLNKLRPYIEKVQGKFEGSENETEEKTYKV